MKWFKHEGNARGDEKIEKLLMKYGVEGYGLYFYCVEIIAGNLSTENITFELKHDAETIGYRLKMDTLKVEEIMKWMVNANLFQISPTTKRIVCHGLAKRLDISTSQNPEFKRILSNPEFQKVLDTNRKYQELLPEEKRKEETRKEDKIPAHHKHGLNKHVLLTDTNYSNLCDRYGKSVADEYIQKVDDYCENHGKSYSNWVNAVHTYIRNDEKSGKLQSSTPREYKKCPACGGEMLGKQASVCMKCGWSKSRPEMVK